jgi:ribonuclease HII
MQECSADDKGVRRMTLVAGVDEAGRGPVIGPLVLAGVLLDEEDLPRLHAMGVRDSQLLTPYRRSELHPKILSLARGHEVVRLSPREVDRYVLRGQRLRKLNWLEAINMAKIIERLRPDVVYVDASDVIASRFGEQIRELLPFEVRVVSEHFADRNYPIVGAASIVAKVHRDLAVAKLRKRFGDLGSGYPSDLRTVRFLEQWSAEHGSMPSFVRKSWKTVRRLGGGQEAGLADGAHPADT